MEVINEKQKKFAINFIIYIITFCFLCFIGITRTFADTNINMSTWTNVTGRKWSSNRYEYSSDIISDTDTIRAYYNVASAIYTPPITYDYVDFLYFQNNNGSNFNPCNDDDFKTNFYLKFSTPSFVNYVSRVRFAYHSDTGLDSCIISSRNSTTGRVDVSCSTHYESDASNLIIWVDFNRNIPDTQNSWLYIQKNFPLTCMTNSQAIINNQNQNTQNIINNNNQNSQNIIDNQNQNTQDIIDSNKVCEELDLVNSPIKDNNMALNSSGSLVEANNFAVSDYVKLNHDNTYTLTKEAWGSARAYCIYDNNKSLISCTTYQDGTSFTITDAYFIRYTISLAQNRIVRLYGQYCENGNQVLNDSINNLDDTLNDDDTTDAENEASEFFSSFDTETFGLTSIITAPLNLIRSVIGSNSSCTTLNLPLPYLDNKTLQLPCMSSIYQQYFGTFFTLYQTITYGIVAYWVIVRIFNQVKDFKNPEHDEIEVMDL